MTSIDTQIAGNNPTAVFAASLALEAMRYEDETERVLARYGEADALFPDPDDLAEAGADLCVLLSAVNSGLGPQVLGLALADIEPALLSEAFVFGLEPGAVEALLSEYGGPALSGHLSNFVEAAKEAVEEPDPLMRALRRYDS